MAARILVLSFWIASLAGLVYAQEEDENQLCFECHGYEGMTVPFEDTEVSAWVEPDSFAASAHGRLACTECHQRVDLEDHPSRELPTQMDYAREMVAECESCHAPSDEANQAEPRSPGAPRIAGLLHPVEADFLCTDCHDPHTMKWGKPGAVETSERCLLCHDDVASTLAASVHGQDVHGTDCPDLPVCASCHEGHAKPAKPGSPDVALRVRLASACRQCHGDEEIASRHGLSSEVVDTYLADFHGVTLKLYEQNDRNITRNVLVCADCHGAHDVQPVTEENAATMKAGLVEVCQGCHADISDDFPSAWLSHYPPSLAQNPLVFLVKIAYWFLIPFVIVGLTLQIIFHLVVMPIRKRRSGGKVDQTKPPIPEGLDPRRIPSYFVRFSRRQRLDHLLGLVGFAVLVLTGIPQKFHDAGWAQSIVLAFGGIDMIRLVHRAAGVVFATVMVLHILSAIVGVLRGRSAPSMVPNRKDFTDAIQNLSYYLGTAKQHAKFDRFDYRQKFEWWGMILGSTIMVLTGFILFFPTWFAEALPAQFIPAAKVAHSFEAMMALLTIVVWHMYSVMLDPEVRPLDTSIFTGKIPRERMEESHPLEYERVLNRMARQEREEAARAAQKQAAELAAKGSRGAESGSGEVSEGAPQEEAVESPRAVSVPRDSR